MRSSPLLAFCLLSLAFGCARKTTGTVTVKGVVSELGSSDASPLDGATVRVSCDLDGDGIIQPEEFKEGTTADDGSFTVSAGTLDGKEISVRFSSSSTNSTVRVLSAKTGDQSAWFDVSLVRIEKLACAAGKCVSPDRGLKVDGLDEGFEVRGTTFNPVDSAGAMPGGFIDSEGKLLTSGVFATVEVEDADGNPVSKLSKAATLRMRVPRETWAETVDIQPGNDRIDVPMYAFDEAKGSFVREGTGFYEDGTGALLAEAKLPELIAGTLPGVVFARAEVTHFSTWNVDWPATSQTCISGLLLKEDGSPAANAQLEVQGISYTGRSPDKVTDAAGRYCVPVMRSEAAGEDFGKSGPGNGRPGEKQRVVTIVRVGPDAWDLGEIDTPEVAGCACDSNKSDTLTAANRLLPRSCTITGTVYGIDGMLAAQGTAVSASSVFAVPEGTPACTDCTGSAAVDAQGAFTLKKQAFHSVRLNGIFARDVNGQQQIEEDAEVRRVCPSTPVTLRLRVSRKISVATVTLTGNTLSWTPPEPALAITVVRNGNPAWMVSSSTGLAPPITIGQVPAGAFSVVAWPGGPPQPGDDIAITGNHVDEAGVDISTFGSFTVP